MGLMSDKLQEYLSANNVPIRVGDSRNPLTDEEKYARNTPYEQQALDGLGRFANDATSGKLLKDIASNFNPLWLFPPAQLGMLVGKVAEYTNPGNVNFSNDKGFLGNALEGYKLGGRIANSGFGQLIDSTAGTLGYGIHRALPNSGADNTLGALSRAIGEYGHDMQENNNPHIENPNDSLAIDVANIVGEAAVSSPTSIALGLAGAGIGGVAVRGGAALLRGIPGMAGAVSKAAGFVDSAGNTLKNLPAVGRVLKHLGLPSAENVVGGVSSGLMEGSMEGYEAYQQYIDDAKKNGTYVAGETEAAANRIADAVAKSNIFLLGGTNTAEQALLFGKRGKGLWKRALGIAGTAGQEGLEEASQQVIQNEQASKAGYAGLSDYLNPEAWLDPRVGHAALVGATMGGGMGALMGGGASEAEEESAQNNAPTLTSGNADIDAAINAAAARHGVPADLLHAVARAESDYDQSSVSSTGAKGIMQLMPDTAAALGVDADDMAQNIEGGARYLKQQLDDFGGNVEMALAAYNAGPGAVEKYKGVPPYEETRNYVAKIMGILDGANMNPATEAEPAHSLLDDAEPFIGTRMDNGTEGCVEAVTKIGAAGSDFLRAELEAGVVNVDRLVEDAGDRVIPFDASRLEEGDVIVYGDKNDAQRHVVLYDGKGGYIGNSSSQNLVVHASDYNAMGSYYPTKIIKSGGRYGGTVNISSVSGSVRPIDYTGLVVDAKNLQANAAAMKALIEGDKLTPAQKAAIIDAAEIIRDTPTEASTASPGEDALDYNAWQRLIDHKDVKGIFAKDPERVTRMVMRGEETQRKAQTVAAIENQQKVAQAQAIQAQVQAAAQAQPAANPAESAARLASVQQELSMPPMAQQEIAARLASYAQTTPHDVERVVIQNGLAHGDFTGIARALPEVYRAAAGRWMQQPQEQAQPQPQAQPQTQTQPPQPTAMPAQQDMQVPNVQANDVAAPPSQEMTAQMPQQMQEQAQAVPTTEDLADIRQKLSALDEMMQGNPTYVEARRRGDWQTAAQEAAKAGHHDFARFYQMLHEKATGAPINITPYQNPAEKAAAEQGAVRPTPAPVPINHVDSMRPVDIPKSYGARRDFGRGLIKAMRMRNLPDVRALNDDLRDGEKRAIEHALKRIAQADEENMLLRGETAAQRANDNETGQAESRKKQDDDVQVESAQKQGKEKTANEGGVVVTGKEFGEYRDIKELRKKALQYYKEHLQGTSVENALLGKIDIDDIGLAEFTGSGKRELKNSSAKEEKLLLVKHLPALIHNATDISGKKSSKESHAGEYFYYLHTAAEIQGVKTPVEITLIKRNNRTIQYYNHTLPSLEKGKKIESASVSTEPESLNGPSETPSIHALSSVSNIPSEQEKSKGKSVQAKSAPLTKQEQEALTGTSEEAKEAYRIVRDKLAKSKNKSVVRAAKVGATLFARHADIYAKAYSKATGKPYTALDYLQDKFGLDADGKEADGSANGFGQALNAGVNLDEQVPVVDITAALPLQKMSNKDVLNFLRGVAQQQNTITSADGKAVFDILPKDVRHITFSSNKKASSKEFRIRKAGVLSIQPLLQNAVLVESTPNRKTGKKPNVRAYHRFYVPVRFGNDVKTLRIVAEEQDGTVTLQPTDVNLYDIIVEQKAARTPAGISPVMGSANGLSTISIRDMLSGVKDADGNVYAQRAWVGSAANFDKFDLGYVGTGEGAQVHGYGLYSAQGRNVAEGYKEKLSALLNEAEGDPVDYNYVEVIQFNGYRYEKPEGYDLWTFEPGTADEVYIDDPGEDAVLEKLNEVQDVDKARAFFEEELEAKRKGEWGETEYSEDTLEKAVAMLSPDNIYDEAFEVSTEEPPEPEAFGGTLFEVEIPDDDVLLDEQKPLAEQPKKVLQGLRKTLKSLSVDELNRFLKQAAYGEEEYSKIQQELQTLSILVSAPISVGRGGRFGKHALLRQGYSDENIADFQANPERGKQEAARLREEYAPRIKELKKQARAFATRYLRDEYVMQNRTGRNFYQALSAAYASDKEASQTLNKYGIKGITYVGQQDGRCFVIFDDKAIEVINKFNQRMNSICKGSITPQASGRRVISLFEQADESTFLHEMGHMFLMDLEDIAALDEASAEDLETVRDWATWQEGQAKEYEDTPWQKEFSEREKALLAAKKRGDVVEVRKLKREWEQERFARGFERYLETGKAPTSVLKRIFQKFKKFLQSIYQAFKGTGGKASPEVEAVMGRMIAEEEQAANSEFGENPVQAKSAPIQADFSASKLKGATGRDANIVTDSGEEIPVRYRLVEALSLVTSNSAKDFSKNPAYPKSLQPRDRERANMQQQIREMASRLRPEDLAASRSVNLGAPVVRADGVVLNGNGRAIAITRALLGNTFRDSTGKGYRAFLVEHAEEFGFKPETVQRMKAPMLVREVTGGLNAEQVKAVTTSTAGGSRLGASEQAKQDAEKITLEDLARYEENERGDLTTAANRDFVAGILYRVAGKNDVNAYTDAKGQVNADGIQRVKRALFQKAYGDDDLLSRMSESTNDDTRNITNGLTIAAPYIARANEKMARGTAHSYKLGETIADAVKRYNHLHDIGQSVENYLDQQAMFAEYEDSPEVREVLRVLNENRRSGKRIAQFVRRVGEIVEAQGNPNEISLMEGGEPLSLGDIIEVARKKFAEEEASRTALVHEAETLYQQAAERFPGIQDKEVASHVREAIQTTLDFGSLDGEIRAVAGNIYQDANGTTFSLFGNGGGTRSAVRNPSAREIQRQEIKAQKRGKIYGLGITRALVNDGAVSLVGQKAKSPAALAEIAQVLRHPGYEKFHIVYTNANGAVVYHETVSSRLPHCSVINAPEDEKGAITSKDVLQNMHKRIEENLRKTGADKFYYIHNHPSGNPKPSAADIQVTKRILDIKNRTNERAFAGHIVLDHNKYAVIDESLQVGEFRLKNKTPMTFEVPEKTHPALEITISRPNDTSRIAEMCATDAETVAFHLTQQLVVRGVQKIHDDFKKKSWDKQMRYLRHCARIAGGTRIVLATSNRMLFEFGKADINNGRESGILDIVFMQDGRAIETGNNVGESVMDRPNWFGLDMDNVESQRLLEPTRQYGVSLDTLFQEAPALKDAALKYGATEKAGRVTFENPEREKEFVRIAEALQGDVAKKLSANRQETLSKVLKEVDFIAPEKLAKIQQGIADFGKAMGVPVVFFKGVTNLHGFYASNGVTFLNTESETSLRWTFWHEALHWMKANNEELFREIIEDVEKAGSFTKAQLDGYRKAIGAPELSDADVIEEMLADALPDVKKRVPFLKDLGKRNKSLAERLVGWIREVMDRFRDFFHTPEMGLTTAQSTAMRNAFAALARDMVDERGRRIFRVDEFSRRITLANGAPLPSAKYSLDNREGRGDNEDRISKAVFDKHLNDGIMKMVEERVRKEIGEHVDFAAISDPVARDAARDGLPYIKKMLVQYNIIKAQKMNPAYADRYAVMIEYARRCFDNDSRVGREAARGLGQNDGQGRMDSTGNENHAEPNVGRSAERGGRSTLGLSRSVSGEKSGARAHFERLYEDMKKHPETGAFSMVKFSRDSSKPGSMGMFRKLLVKFKIGEAVESNLEVHRSNKEKQLVMSAEKLNKFMVDKALTEKNILKTEDLGGGKIRVTYMPQDFRNVHFLNAVNSVRQLRKKNPFIKAIYDLGSRAMRLQEHLRNDGAKTVKEFRELTKNKNDRKLVSSILLEGDAAGKEYGVQELRAMGTNANVIKAYQLVRRTMREWYKRINDARMQVETRTKTLSKNDLADFKKNHWIADSDVLGVEEKGDGKVLLTWRGGKTYETKNKVMTKDELDTLLQDKDINVAHFHKIGESYGVDNYSVDYVERIKPLGNLTGYMPHFFHEWMVYEKHKDPKTGEVRLTTIGSGRSMNDAVRLGNEIARKNSDKEYVVRPKGFDLKVENSVVIGDVDFQQMAAKLAENTEMTLSDANAFLRDSAGATMRARHRFFGNAMHRKGAKGFDTDITYVLTHYLNTSARYIAMEQFKPRAVTLYERWFGAFDVEPEDRTAKYVKGLIKDINGDPRPLEKAVSELIMKTPIGKMISDAYGDRAALAVNGELSTWNAISKLGLGNIASAAVNLSQFINIAAAMGDYIYAMKGLRSAIHPTAADMKILEESGVLDEINQAADNGGYTQRRFGRVGSVYGIIKRGGELSLLPFQWCDMLMRKTAILGAYKQGVEKKGLTHEKAMERARGINYDANFDYSAANAPLMIRAGSVVTQQMFQFQKYPIMQMEFMYNILFHGTRGQKASFLLPYVLMCGIPGIVPFGEIFNQIFSFLFGLASGDDKDIGNEIKAEALRWAGKDPAKKFIVNWAIYGVLAPTFGIDVSKRIGISGAFSGEFFGAQKPESVGGMLAMQLGGPMASTAVNVANQFHNGNPIEALKAFSPALGNIWQAMVGVSRTTRHRVKSRYETTYDRIIHAMGFRSVDESNNSFITSYEFDRKDAETHAKQEAIMDYLDDPSEANRQRINALGIKDKAIEEARIQQERSATERAKGGRPKVESGKTSKRRTSHKRKEEKPKKETLFDTIDENDEGM